MAQHPVILFDGVCNLCNGAVNFVIDRDRAGRFHFASLQSTYGAREAARLGLRADPPESLVLLDEQGGWLRSAAALRIARELGFPWSLLYVSIVVPRPVRDWAYDVVARNRYKWFGRREACRVPTPELRGRFVD